MAGAFRTARTARKEKSLFPSTGPHCAERTNRMKPKSQASSEGPFILSEGSIRNGDEDREEGGREEVCEDSFALG